MLGIYGGRLFAKRPTRCTYQESLFVHFTAVQRTGARNISYYSPDRMFCPPRLTHSCQSTPRTHTISFSRGSMPSTEKKKLKLKKKIKKNNLNQPDLARQQIGAKDYGGSHTLGILRRLLLPVSCLLSLSLALSHSPGLNFDRVFVNTWRQQLKKWPFLIGLNLDSTVTIPLLF